MSRKPLVTIRMGASGKTIEVDEKVIPFTSLLRKDIAAHAAAISQAANIKDKQS